MNISNRLPAYQRISGFLIEVTNPRPLRPRALSDNYFSIGVLKLPKKNNEQVLTMNFNEIFRN